MDKKQAKNLIRNTLESTFDKEKFENFVRNLLKSFDNNPDAQFTNSGQYIPEAYREYIKSFSRIGKYQSNGNEIDILIVRLQKETSLYRARTMQRNFIARHLNGSRGGKQKDAALVAFVSPDNKDWRFSLVKMDYRFEEMPSGKNKVKEAFTPARRWSFLVGENEKSHTAQQQLLPLFIDDTKPTLERISEAFNIERVSNEFFEKYRSFFIHAKEELDRIIDNDKIKADFTQKHINTVDFAKKLLGQMVFLYFLQKKGWFGVSRGSNWGEGSRNFLRELFEMKHGSYVNFFNDILEPLFYEALRNDRSFDDHYYSHFNCKIPFLNGGLFDPIGGYDWVNLDITLPNELFSNQNKTAEGDVGNGILDIFDRYNFTVCEDEPLEKEVAIDPELLGKTYERFNAIRSDNFNEYLQALRSGKKQEEYKFNKEYGVYYTPREIVHYMCRQSLTEYLVTLAENNKDLAMSRSDIEDLMALGDLITEHEATARKKVERIENGLQKSSDYSSLLPESIRKHAAIIDQWLADVLICDPAMGSGAFPVGMLTEIVRMRTLLSVFIDDANRHSYLFKRHCIEHSLYGVDIDPGAVEIARLRLWLSLVVDEDDIARIKPLPNLDYKIVCGNSLLGIEVNLFNNNLFQTLEEQKLKHFNETSPYKKQEYKREIDTLIDQITEAHPEFDFKIYFSEVFHKKGSSEQGIIGGFDIVIGNPPYIQLQKERGSLAKLYEKQNYETFSRMGDIYTLFYEKGLQLLKPEGHLCFITSNKWMRAGYGEGLRKFFQKYNPKIIIDLGPGIFESATVDTNILIIQKKQTNQKELKAVTLQRQNGEPVNIEAQLKERGVTLSNLTKDAWFIGSNAEQKLKEKIEHIGKPLKEWDVKIYRGVLTGLNEAFIIDSKKREEILANCKDEGERKRTEAVIKPILRGRDIKRYHYEWAGLWVIGTFPALRLKINDYQAIKKFFLDHFDIRQLEQSGKKYPELGFDARKKTGNKWFETQDQIAYYPEFEKEKVFFKAVGRNLTFSKVEPGIMVTAPASFLTGNQINYILGVLCSRFTSYYVAQTSDKTGAGDIMLNVQSFERIKIPPITPSNQSIVQQIEVLVDKILYAKKENSQTDTSEWEREIDRLVYKLYELTEEEIKIIEGKT